jgi:hypothetical protein
LFSKILSKDSSSVRTRSLMSNCGTQPGARVGAFSSLFI